MLELTVQLDDDQREYETALQDKDTLINKMRLECNQLIVELQTLLDTKQTLDAEILLYRKMLEGEENRKGLKQLVESVMAGQGKGTPCDCKYVIGRKFFIANF